MAQDETATSDVAVAERPDDAPVAVEPLQPEKKSKKKSKDDEDLDYEVNFETPFGKIEFELEPSASKERKDREKREKREKSERDAAKAAAKLAKKAQKQLADAKPEQQIIIQKGGSKLVPILVIFLLVAGAVALAIWLFARPGEQDQDVVPPEFRNTDDEAPAESEPPQGFAAKAQHRLRTAIHAGRQASREAQSEQERKFQDLTGKK
jgi:hypothetical protein